VVPESPAVSMSKQVLEDGQWFPIAPQADGFTIAKYLELTK
jgi:hypothetical protein